jgi:replicative DNA helicase
MRHVIGQSGISIYDLRGGKLEDWQYRKLYDAQKSIHGMKLVVQDAIRLTLPEFIAKVYYLKMKYNIVGWVVDHLQYMVRPKAERDDIAYGIITKAMKAVNMELGIWGILLSQISRAGRDQKQNAGRPTLSGLKGSGDIEDDADVAVLIWRPDRYAKTIKYEGRQIDTDGKVFLLVDKNRDGEPAEIMMRFEKKSMRFIEYREEDESWT